MGAVIRQQFINGNNDQLEVKEILIDIEQVRPHDGELADHKIYIRLNPHGHGQGDAFKTIFYCPDELLSYLFDGKRTSNPAFCQRSRLKIKSNVSGNIVVVEEAGKHGLDAHVGDPIVIMSDPNGANKCYALIEEVNDNQIKINKEIPKYFRGAIVQNLANRWHSNINIKGAKAQLSSPPTPAFIATRKNDTIEVKVSRPMNTGSLKFYDIYVRSKPFNTIEYHWIPDAADISALSEFSIVNTVDGGVEAGGTSISNKNPLYIVVVGKDKEGSLNVNESECIPKAV